MSQPQPQFDQPDRESAPMPPPMPAQPSDGELDAIRRERWQGRVNRVLAVMREEGVDWQGLPVFTPDGRVVVRVLPVDVREQQGPVR